MISHDGMISIENLLKCYPDVQLEDNAESRRVAEIKERAFRKRVVELVLPDPEILAARVTEPNTGGWDVAGLEEVDEASHLSGLMRPLVNIIFIVPSKWGAKVSPLHNRFPITMRESAMAEVFSYENKQQGIATPLLVTQNS